MTKPLPFTQAAVRKAIRAARAEGMYVVGVRPDGTVLVSNEPLALQLKSNSLVSKWANNGGQ